MTNQKLWIVVILKYSVYTPLDGSIVKTKRRDMIYPHRPYNISFMYQPTICAVIIGKISCISGLIEASIVDKITEVANKQSVPQISIGRGLNLVDSRNVNLNYLMAIGDAYINDSGDIVIKDASKFNLLYY